MDRPGLMTMERSSRGGTRQGKRRILECNGASPAELEGAQGVVWRRGGGLEALSMCLGCVVSIGVRDVPCASPPISPGQSVPSVHLDYISFCFAFHAGQGLYPVLERASQRSTGPKPGLARHGMAGVDGHLSSVGGPVRLACLLRSVVRTLTRQRSSARVLRHALVACPGSLVRQPETQRGPA